MATAKCEYCLKPAEQDEMSCSNCGGKVRVLEPWVLQCGWCGSSNRRDQVQSCKTCGGELPEIPGSERAPNPPPTPRKINSSYRNGVMIWKNVLVLIGAVFTVIFCWTIIFPIIGIPLWYFGRRNAQRKLSALEFGTPTKGEITEVYVDTESSTEPGLCIQVPGELITLHFYGASENSMNTLAREIKAAHEAALRAPIRSRIQSKIHGLEASVRETTRRIKSKVVTRTV